MVDNTQGLRKSAEERTKMTLEKVDKTIRELSLKGERINFNSIVVASGVSKSFLYTHQEIKERIEELRKKQVSQEMNQRAKYDKTAKAKDIVIMAKDKRIRELESENKKLKEQLTVIRGKVYEKS